MDSTVESNKFFSCDPGFCSRCGSILPLPGDSDKVVCKVCRQEQDVEEFEGQVEYSCKIFAERKEKLKLSSGGDGPLVERRCSECGHDKMTYSTQQTRSADEGQTVFYTCPKCNFKETENS